MISQTLEGSVTIKIEKARQFTLEFGPIGLIYSIAFDTFANFNSAV